MLRDTSPIRDCVVLGLHLLVALVGTGLFLAIGGQKGPFDYALPHAAELLSPTLECLTFEFH